MSQQPSLLATVWAEALFGATPILAAHKRVHNTSLLPDKQLVRELKLRIAILEIFYSLPRSISRSAAFPMNQNLPAAVVEASADYSSRSRNHPTMEDRRQRNQSNRWLPHKFLQESNMEDVMNTCLRREVQTICHRSNALNHLIWPKEARPELGWCSSSNAHSCTVMEAQPDPIAHRKVN